MAYLNIAAPVGRWTIALINKLGNILIFFLHGLSLIFFPPFQLGKIVQQVYFIGAKSVFIVCLTGAFTGMVLGLQAYYALVKSGSQSLLGTAVALSLIRELGPVMTALMVTARAGSAMAAELGIMRISEQIDALETMDVNPIRFLVSPRIAASLISFTLLTAMFDVVGVYGGYVSGSVIVGINPGMYFYRVQSSLEMKDIAGGFAKSLVFAAIVATICCFQGYFTHTRVEEFGAKGVSAATTSAVVISSVLILSVDYVMTSVLL